MWYIRSTHFFLLGTYVRTYILLVSMYYCLVVCMYIDTYVSHTFVNKMLDSNLCTYSICIDSRYVRT